MRQRGDTESQGVAEAKAARDAALATFNRERRQEHLRDAQELIECLGSGMDLLSVEQIGQIKEAAAAAGSEPREALRSFGQWLRDLRNENPHASEADFKEAVRGAVQAMIAKARGQRRRADTQRVAAESDTPRDVARLLETRRMTRWTPSWQDAAGSRVRGGADAHCWPRGDWPKLRSGGSRACLVQGRRSRPTGQCGSPPGRRTPLGGCSGGQATYAPAAQCKRATASQGTASCTASQAGRKHAAAQARRLRLSPERLWRILAEATSGRSLGRASRPTSHGTWVGGNTGLDQCHECHCQPGHSQPAFRPADPGGMRVGRTSTAHSGTTRHS